MNDSISREKTQLRPMYIMLTYGDIKIVGSWRNIFSVLLSERTQVNKQQNILSFIHILRHKFKKKFCFELTFISKLYTYHKQIVNLTLRSR